MSSSAQVGFAVIYRWRVHPDKEEEFIAAWSFLTKRIVAERGGLGSRLHRATDGTFVAYAQWPSAELRQRSIEVGAREPFDPQIVAKFRGAIIETFDEIELVPVEDLLVEPVATQPPGS